MVKTNEKVMEIRKRLDNDPLISDPSRVYLSAEKKGTLLKKYTCVFLEGNVANEMEQKEVEKVVRESAADCEVVENLKVLR